MWTSHDLMVGVCATVVLAATSRAGIAGESGKFVGAHEVPPFVCERVELVSGEVNRFAAEVSHGGSHWFASGEVSDPGRAVCAREATLREGIGVPPVASLQP
jgi:hypothetical protein